MIIWHLKLNEQVQSYLKPSATIASSWESDSSVLAHKMAQPYGATKSITKQSLVTCHASFSKEPNRTLGFWKYFTVRLHWAIMHGLHSETLTQRADNFRIHWLEFIKRFQLKIVRFYFDRLVQLTGNYRQQISTRFCNLEIQISDFICW